MTTINAAGAMGFEDDFGSIEVGKSADLIILENDPLDGDPVVGLATNTVLGTIIRGELAYCRGEICRAFEDGPVAALPEGVCVAPPEGLTAWWPADSDADDAVGSNDGTLVDAAAFDVGAVGQAFRLDGGAIALDEQPDLSGGFTIEGWIRLDGHLFDDYQSVFNNDQMFLRKDNRPEGNLYSLFIKLDDGTVGPRAQSVTLPVEGEWTHLAGTWDGAELRLSVNGLLEGTSDRSGTLVATSTTAQIGRGEQSDEIGPIFYGLIDELSFYDRALTLDEVAAIVKAGSGGKCR